MMNKRELAERLRLYLICGSEEKLLEKTEAALQGGVTAVQLRMKNRDGREIYETALSLRRLCDSYKALFIVNDRVDIALAAQADGVHLGQKDLPPVAARKLGGAGFIIGGTARTPELARKAEAEGADYIGCGAAFETATKGDAVVIGPEGIKEVLTAISIPSVAIGGIEAANLKLLRDCGASGISLSGAIMKAKEPQAAARELRKLCDELFGKGLQ